MAEECHHAVSLLGNRRCTLSGQIHDVDERTFKVFGVVLDCRRIGGCRISPWARLTTMTSTSSSFECGSDRCALGHRITAWVRQSCETFGTPKSAIRWAPRESESGLLSRAYTRDKRGPTNRSTVAKQSGFAAPASTPTFPTPSITGTTAVQVGGEVALGVDVATQFLPLRRGRGTWRRSCRCASWNRWPRTPGHLPQPPFRPSRPILDRGRARLCRGRW